MPTETPKNGDFILHGPNDLLGEEAAQRWQEECRRKKAQEEQGQSEPSNKRGTGTYH